MKNLPLNRAHRDVQHRRDLVIFESLEVAQEHHLALRRLQPLHPLGETGAGAWVLCTPPEIPGPRVQFPGRLLPLLTPEMLQPRVSGNLEQPGTEQVPISQTPALAIHGEHDILGEIFRQASFTSAPEEISENLRADRP